MARIWSRRAVAALAVISALAAAGCAGPSEPKLTPKVVPPAIKNAGTLRAGIDLSYPPFGGVDNERQAGIDIDTAGALAGKLGLKLVVVDVKASEAATALADGRVDAVFSVPFSDDLLSRATIAGTYITDGPAFFLATEGTASVEPSLTLDTLRYTNLGAQQEAAAYWKLASEMGPELVKPFPTLREALGALAAGQLQAVGGDALVGAYIARDFPNVHLAGQIEPAHPLGVAVAANNTKLADAVRTSLDTMAADGVLDAIRRKWVGDLAKLSVPESVDTSGTESETPPSP